MAANRQIECSAHGTATPAFVCVHLLERTAAEVYEGAQPEPPDPDDEFAGCVNAWCERCEAMRRQAGEWTEEAERFADIKVICLECYERICAELDA